MYLATLILGILIALANFQPATGRFDGVLNLVDDPISSPSQKSSPKPAASASNADDFHFSWVDRMADNPDVWLRLAGAIGKLNGSGVVKDFPAGVKELQALSAVRVAPAEFALASLILTGRGVDFDRAKGLELLTDAANQNYPAAQSMLGEYYVRDVQAQGGALVTREMGYMWISLAADSAFGPALSAKDGATKALTPDQIAAAEALKQGWLAKLDPLHRAVVEGKIDQVTALIAKGVNPNGKNGIGLTPLMGICFSSRGISNDVRAQIARLLVSRGADVNLPSLALPKMLSPGGVTQTSDALAICSSEANVLLVETLVNLGAQVNLPLSGGATALIVAAGASGHVADADVLEVVKVLRKAGADVNAQTSANQSALSEAARTNRYEVAKLLLAANVDRNSQASQRALSEAKGTEIENLLLDAGIQPGAVPENLAAKAIQETADLSKRAQSDVTYEGHDGSTIENAIKIHGAKSDGEGAVAILLYFGQHLPDCKIIAQALVAKADRAYDRITCANAAGAQQTHFFDITESFGRMDPK